MLTGFETYVASAREAALKITKTGIVFNKATATRLGKPEYVELGIDVSGKRIAIVRADKKTDLTFNFSLDPKTGLVKWGNKELLKETYKIIERDPEQSYRVIGEVYEKDRAIIFDLNQAQVIKGRCKL